MNFTEESGQRGPNGTYLSYRIEVQDGEAKLTITTNDPVLGVDTDTVTFDVTDTVKQAAAAIR